MRLASGDRIESIGAYCGGVTAVSLTNARLSANILGVRMPSALALCLAGVLTVSAAAGAAIIVATGLTLEVAGFSRFLALAGVMFALAFWCGSRRLDPRMGAAASIVGAATLSLVICGIVSNAGLRLGAPLADARLAAADALVGLDAGDVIRTVAHQPWLTAVLSLLYNSSGVAVIAVIGWSLARKKIAQAWELVATAVISMQLVAIASPAFPAWGAMRHFGLEHLQGYDLPVGAGVYQWPAFAHFYAGTDPVLRLADMGGVVAFPSFHTVLALLITQALGTSRLWPLALVWTAGIILAAIPMGGHYVVDLAGGFAIWLAAATIARRAVASSPSA